MRDVEAECATEAETEVDAVPLWLGVRRGEAEGVAVEVGDQEIEAESVGGGDEVRVQLRERDGEVVREYDSVAEAAGVPLKEPEWEGVVLAVNT